MSGVSMILYFAGNLPGEEPILHAGGIRCRLLSFAEKNNSGNESSFVYWITNKPAGSTIFLDSGAYGAFTRGVTIDIPQYEAYIKTCEQNLNAYASLDVIGDWRGSARNYDRILSDGLRPVPTFHMGSPNHELHRLLKMTDYIALGGVVGARQEDMRPWLDRCFSIIKNYWPKKVHIFGVMAQWALERYPFFSADSTGAVIGGGMGRLTLFEEGRFVNYDWREYAKKFYDGEVMDKFSNSSSAKSGSAHIARRLINVKSQLQLQRYITDVWTNRGIAWEDECAVSTAPLVISTGTP